MQFASRGLADRPIVDNIVDQRKHLGGGSLACVAQHGKRGAQRVGVGSAQQRLTLGGLCLEQSCGEIGRFGSHVRVTMYQSAKRTRLNSAKVARAPKPLVVAGVGLVIVAAVAVGWFVLQQPAQSFSSGIARPGGPAPQIALPVVGGGASDLRAERGNVILVNFWATWCEPCKSEMPGLQTLANDLHNQPFRLYSVDLQEDADQIQAFEHEYGLNLYALMDQDGDATRAYGVRALPSTFLVDKNGVVSLQRLGPLATGGPETMWSEAWLANQVHSLLSSG